MHCIRNEECDDLELRRLNRVLPDEAAAADTFGIDESGEDTSFPKPIFFLWT